MIEWLVRVVVLALEVALALPLLYLLLLSAAALVAARRARSVAAAGSGQDARSEGATPPSIHFALLVPAHDEALVITELLESVAALDYPAERRDVYVIADNCTDDTADLVRKARTPNVQVRERRDDHQRGKGYALRWLLEELERAGQRYDAYVIVDADSQLSPNFLRAMAARLARGEDALQGQYRVQNAASAWTASLRAMAFALINHLRPLGRSLLGLSAGLKGNGMCFSRRLIERHGWGSYSLAEDAEYHLALVEAGVRVRYVSEAVVTSAMPTSLRQAYSQQQRWERGRLVLARAHAAPLVLGAVRHRDLARLDAIAEVCLPPLSLLVGVLALALGLAAALRWQPGIVGASVLVGVLGFHLVVGMALARLAPRAYLSILYAPLYVLWKIGVYLRAAVQRGAMPWMRTVRVAAAPSERDGPMENTR